MASVLVVRKRDGFTDLLENGGFEVINCPAIETVVLQPEIVVDPAIDGVFITSRAAADVFQSVNGYKGKVYVLGRSSLEALKDRGFDIWFDPSVNTSAELLAAIPRSEIEGKRLLFVRGEDGMRTIPDTLRGVADLSEMVVYRNERVPIDRESIDRDFNWICFFSPSGVRSFISQVGTDLLRRSRIAAIGPTTADFLERNGRRVDLVASASNAETFAAEIIEKGNDRE